MKKMGYEGKSLGVNSQGIMNPIQVVELLWYIGLGYVRKEETWDSSSDKSETMQDVEITSPPSSDSENFEGRAKEISPQHTCTRGSHSRKIMSIKKQTWHKDSSPHQGSRNYGGRRNIAPIATKVDIREPQVGISIQSYDKRRIGSIWKHLWRDRPMKQFKREANYRKKTHYPS